MPADHAAYWDAQAATYDRSTAWVERRLLADARAWVGERVRGRTLEVAAGTGGTLADYATRASDVTLTDRSEQMLGLARTRARALGVEVTALRCDAAALPFPAASMDTVVCTFALCCVPDEVAVLRELARVVRPDGRVLLADHVESSAALGRLAQRGLDLAGRRHGEHHRRRPLLRLGEAGLVAVEHASSRYRLVEQVAARPERRARPPADVSRGGRGSSARRRS
ncbi:methyltransferase domain-containing protein [Cellulomonas sp. DKR-3]|uniref:Methyltransferase domain-containing protein n=1 Tax=Cellulomonas fulva TaxID=2835530 RepID=A0ABS5TYA6_9CELL|nr:class I SAM-dependent methyltransferase [Cellulomonas fulva]MBT0994100.1 methyltransferase domain-containing protein [Cellulomonas fulva]